MAIFPDVIKYSQLVLGLRRYYRAGTISFKQIKAGEIIKILEKKNIYFIEKNNNKS